MIVTARTAGSALKKCEPVWTTMQEAVRAVAALSGKYIFLVVPSSPAVEILKHQGFATLDIFQKLMDNASLQEVARGKIVWHFHNDPADEWICQPLDQIQRLEDISK